MQRSRIISLLIWTSFILLIAVTATAFLSDDRAAADGPTAAVADNSIASELALAEEDEAEVDDESRAEEDEGEFEEEELEELERHHQHLEVEMAGLRLNFGRLELVGHVAEVAEDEVRSAAFAITHITELAELEEAADILNDALADADSPAIKRMLRMKLAEIHAELDQPAEAREHLRKLLTGK